MLFFLVFFVSMNLLMIRTEDNIISIELNRNGSQKRCNIFEEVTLGQNSNFTLKIKSAFFIYNASWIIYDKEHNFLPLDNKSIQNLSHSDLKMTFQRNVGSNTTNEINTTLDYTFNARNQEAPKTSQKWIFKFDIIHNYNLWSLKSSNMYIETWMCQTVVKIDPSSVGPDSNIIKSRTPRGSTTDVPNDDVKYWLIRGMACIMSLLFAQTSYIVYKKIRSRKLKKKNDDKDPISSESPNEGRGSTPERNIANRAPLPLPFDEIKKNEPLPPVPVSSIPHGPLIYHYAATPRMEIGNTYEGNPDPLPKESYMNKGLETSEERVTSPANPRRLMEDSFVPKQRFMHKGTDNSDDEISNHEISLIFTKGPLVAKQSFRNKALGHSIEDITSPVFSRRHEGPSVPQQSYKNRMLSNPDKDDRSPGFGRRHEVASVQKESYRNKALENSLEEIRTPNFGRRHEGPSIPKQSYKHAVLDDVDEEVKIPDFARRQIEAKLSQLPPKGVGPSKSFKSPSPSIPQKTYRNAALDDSDEDIKTPGLARRQIEAKLTQLSPKGVTPSKSFKSSSPSIPQQTYRNAVLDDSDEDIKTPGLARRQIEAKLTQLSPKGVTPSKSFKSSSPSIPQQTYRNSVLDDSDEDIVTPGFARQQIQAKLTPLPSKGLGPSKSFKSPTKLAPLPSKGLGPSKSFKSPKPLPRTSTSSPPPDPLEKPVFHPAHRQEPGPPPQLPPLHPKKPSIPVFPVQEACRPQDSRRFSDDEWQYEKLQPSSKYLNNFTDTPYE